jgi:hypothetical protein
VVDRLCVLVVFRGKGAEGDLRMRRDLKGIGREGLGDVDEVRGVMKISRGKRCEVVVRVW